MKGKISIELHMIEFNMRLGRAGPPCDNRIYGALLRAVYSLHAIATDNCPPSTAPRPSQAKRDRCAFGARVDACGGYRFSLHFRLNKIN